MSTLDLMMAKKLLRKLFRYGNKLNETEKEEFIKYIEEEIKLQEEKEAKEMLEKAQVPMAYTTFDVVSGYTESSPIDYLAPFSTAPVCVKSCAIGCAPANPPKIKKEHNMGCYDQFNKDETALCHLTSRLETIGYARRNELRKKFFMDADVDYATKDEILAALKAGNIKFHDCYFTGDKVRPGYGVNGVFALVNPKTDAAGYEVAAKALKTAQQDAEDVIKTSPAADGLKALKAFEAMTF